MSIASQEFRDGAASGAAGLARRARQLIAWGVTVDDKTLDKLAEGIVYEMGGKVHPMDDWLEPHTTPTTITEEGEDA